MHVTYNLVLMVYLVLAPAAPVTRNLGVCYEH